MLHGNMKLFRFFFQLMSVKFPEPSWKLSTFLTLAAGGRRGVLTGSKHASETSATSNQRDTHSDEGIVTTPSCRRRPITRGWFSLSLSLILLWRSLNLVLHLFLHFFFFSQNNHLLVFFKVSPWGPHQTLELIWTEFVLISWSHFGPDEAWETHSSEASWCLEPKVTQSLPHNHFSTLYRIWQHLLCCHCCHCNISAVCFFFISALTLCMF